MLSGADESGQHRAQAVWYQMQLQWTPGVLVWLPWILVLLHGA